MDTVTKIMIGSIVVIASLVIYVVFIAGPEKQKEEEAAKKKAEEEAAKKKAEEEAAEEEAAKKKAEEEEAKKKAEEEAAKKKAEEEAAKKPTKETEKPTEETEKEEETEKPKDETPTPTPPSPPSAAKFFIEKGNQNCEKAGGETISSSEECLSALRALDVDTSASNLGYYPARGPNSAFPHDFSADQTWQRNNFPKGCYQLQRPGNPFQVAGFHNNNNNTIGCSESMFCICKSKREGTGTGELIEQYTLHL